MKKYIGVAMLSLIVNLSFAQNVNITGKVLDKFDNKPIAGTVIKLLKQKDSTLITQTVTNTEGDFVFKNIVSDSLFVKINSTNYQEYTRFFTINNENKILLPIKLTAKGKNLETVTVISRTPPVVQKGDTSQFSASQYKVNPDATTEDLIKKMPGITVAKDGTVTAQGETVKKITIDGKDFFGDDASAALKNVQSDMVDKIQVFDRLSDQAKLTGFDDGNSVKAINIVTKSGMKNGNFGRLYAGYGTNDRYNIGGNSSFLKNHRRISIVGSFNNINQQNFASQDLLGLTTTGSRGGGGAPAGGPGGRPGGGQGGNNDFSVGQSNGISKTNAAGLNFSNQYGKKLTVTGSYFYNNSKNFNQAITNTETFFKPDTSIFSTQNSNTITNNTNHRINARLEYNIDSANSIFYIPSISFQKNDATSYSELMSIYSSVGAAKYYDTLNTDKSKNTVTKNGYNIKNSLLFRHSFTKKGRSISLGINHTLSKNNGDNTLDAHKKYYKNNLLIKDSLPNQLYNNFNDGNSIGGTIAYTEPIGKKGQLQLDYNPSILISNANQQNFNFDGVNYSIFDTTFSNKFDNKITTNNAGITYRFVPGKEELIQIGLSYQNTKLESNRIFPSATNVNQSFSNILPNVIFRKKFSAKSAIRLMYRASTNFPTVSQLQDVVNLSNPLRVSTGNPLLTQSFTHFLGTRFSYNNTKTSKNFFVGLFLQSANDYISNATFIPIADSTIQNKITIKKGSQLSKPINLNGFRTARTFISYSMPLKFIKTTLNLTGGFSYQKLPGLVNYKPINTSNTSYSGSAVFASNISEYVDFNLSYNTNINYSKSNTINTKFVTQAAGLQLNLLNKKGWFIQNDVSYQINSGLSAGFNQQYTLWNAAFGRKFLKKKVGELKLSVFDLLKQNQSITRTVDEKSIQDLQSVVLRQYFMLTFTYSLKNFGKAAKPTNKVDNKEEINRLMQQR
ncbi:MAG: outer membrane beta-barrel protein [Ferruginibacter sp.]|nr:outer membrane beta-barrel protein [Ferruginibacter sp.]